MHVYLMSLSIVEHFQVQATEKVTQLTSFPKHKRETLDASRLAPGIISIVKSYGGFSCSLFRVAMFRKSNIFIKIKFDIKKWVCSYYNLRGFQYFLKHIASPRTEITIKIQFLRMLNKVPNMIHKMYNYQVQVYDIS